VVEKPVESWQRGSRRMFSKGEGGFKDRDLYPFCGGPDGMFTARGVVAHALTA